MKHKYVKIKWTFFSKDAPPIPDMVEFACGLSMYIVDVVQKECSTGVVECLQTYELEPCDRDWETST